MEVTLHIFSEEALVDKTSIGRISLDIFFNLLGCCWVFLS